MVEIEITKDEQKAIKSLERLAKKWPKSLSLFSWSGTLLVMKRIDDGRLGCVEEISGINNDGGDPSSNEVEQDTEIICR
jgi:hypothetical protein